MTSGTATTAWQCFLIRCKQDEWCHHPGHPRSCTQSLLLLTMACHFHQERPFAILFILISGLHTPAQALERVPIDSCRKPHIFLPFLVDRESWSTFCCRTCWHSSSVSDNYHHHHEHSLCPEHRTSFPMLTRRPIQHCYEVSSNIISGFKMRKLRSESLSSVSRVQAPHYHLWNPEQ